MTAIFQPASQLFLLSLCLAAFNRVLSLPFFAPTGTLEISCWLRYAPPPDQAARYLRPNRGTGPTLRFMAPDGAYAPDSSGCATLHQRLISAAPSAQKILIAAFRPNSHPFANRSLALASGVAAQESREQAAAQAYQKASALFQQQQLEQSLAAVEQALKLNPKLTAALTLKARLALAAERYDVAIACLLRVIEIEPDNAPAHFLLGFSRYVENDFKHALPALEQARQLQPTEARTHFYLALTYEALGRTEEAIAGYEQASKLEMAGGAALADTLVAYARLLFTLGRFAASEKLIDRALLAEANSRDAQYEKGRLLLERQAYAAAIKHGQQALALPGVGTTARQIHFLLAKAFSKTGQKELAAEHLAKFRAEPPPLRR